MTTQITQFPTPPQRTDTSAVFSTKGDNFIAAFPQFVIEANQLAVDLNTAMNSAYLGNTATSTTSVTIGTGTKNFTVEANKNFVKGMTLKIAFDATNYMIGEITSYNSSTGALAISVITTLGSGTYAVWSVSPTVYYTPSMIENVIFFNTTLNSTHAGRMITLKGALTISLAAAATLGNGWYVFLRNAEVRDCIIDPNGAELIEGASTATLKGGTFCIIQCDGTAFRLINLINADTPKKGFSNIALITSSQSWIKPSGVTRIRAYAVGAGAAGHATNGSGGGGGLAWGDIGIESTTISGVTIAISGSTTTVSLFGAGIVLTANAASGVTGGTASINSSFVANGGASTGGAGGGVGGASSGTIFGTGVAGSAVAGAGGSGWGGNGAGGGGGGIGSASGGAFSGGTGANQGGRGILNPFTDPLILTFNGVGQPSSIMGAYPYYSPDGVGGCSASNGASGSPATAGNGGFGAGGGGSNVSVGAGISTAGNGGFGGGGGGAIAQTGGIAQAGAGGYGGGGGKASGGSTNNQGAGGAGAVIILY